MSSRLAWGLSTGHLLQEMGYDYYHFSSPRQSPELTELSFSDLLPQLLGSSSERCRAIAAAKLYRHQKEAFEALVQGFNVILKSGTGSGKTEAWFLYSACKRKRALAIYPTLALANDQLSRLREYAAALNIEVLALDALKRDQYARSMGFRELRRKVIASQLIITNPAFLLNELKKMGANRPSLLRQFLQEADFLVVDDFDFYGPRSIALLFSMVKLLVKYVNQGLQLCFLTAGLENPGDVADYLTSINQRKTVIVEGRAFRPENHYYIVLGRNLRRIWELLREKRGELEAKGVGKDILQLLERYEDFRADCYKAFEVAQAAGLDIGELGLDPLPLLARYVEDDGLTLVFTRGIAKAEEISRQLSIRLKKGGLAASHHHLLSKELREELEEAARRGTVKIIVSPRTLSQGIDIGPIKRVVHIGLPDSVREFRQKEGRKGRRQEVPFTETIIFPSGPWTFSLLGKGIEAIKKWIELPAEKILVNKENLYSRLFESLFLLSSPSFRAQLSREDRLFLRSLGLERDGELTETGKQAWLRLNFYEFAPPFGIKRLRLRNARDLEQLEDISHVDLVEKFQVGCIDYSSDGIVIEHRFGGSRSRVVTSVLVDDLKEVVMRRHETLSHVLEEYERIKRQAGERPDLYGDYLNGRVHTEVLCAVHSPSNGFGLYSKIPNRVIWRFKLTRRRLQVIGDRTLVLQDERKFVVPTSTNGWYSDYTYGLSFEVRPEESVELLRLALAFLVILLRRLLGIPFDLIKYDVVVMGNRKIVMLHETESAGLLIKMDWSGFKALVQSYEPDQLDLVFLEEVDELAHAAFLSLKLDWALVKKQAIGLLDYLISREHIIVRVKGAELELPKPSRALGLISMAALDLTLREDISSGLYAIGFYDGEEFQHIIGMKELGEPDNAATLALERLAEAMNRGAKLLLYDLKDVEANLSAAGLTSLRAYLLGISQLGMSISIYHELKKSLGEAASLDALEQALGLKRSIRLQDLHYELQNEARRVPGLSFIRLKQSRFRDKVSNFLQEETKSLYLSYLVLQALEQGKSNKQRERPGITLGG